MPSWPSSSSFRACARGFATGFSKRDLPFCCPLKLEPKADFSVRVDRTRGLSRCLRPSSGAARPQVLEAVSHDLRAQYDLLESDDEDCENPRVECGVDSSVSGDARRFTGQVAYS